MDLRKVLMILQYMQKKKIGETLQILVKNLVLSLHYNGNDSYLFVNGRQELKNSCLPLCIRNLSDQWTTSE